MQIDGNRYNIMIYGGDTTALRLLGVKVLSQNSDPLPNTSYFTRRAAAALGYGLDMTQFEFDNGAIRVCGIIDDLLLGNANSAGCRPTPTESTTTGGCTCWPCSSWEWSQPSPSHTGPCS